MPEDNGWNDLLAAIELLPVYPDQAYMVGAVAEGKWSVTLNRVIYEGPERFTTAELEHALFPYQPARTKLGEALAKPFVVPYNWVFMQRSWQPYQKELSSARQFARILSVQAAMQARRDEHQQALQACQQGMTLGRKLSRGGLMIPRLVGIAVHAITLRSMQHLIRTRPPVEILEETVGFLQHFEPEQVPAWKIATMEAWLYRDKLEDLYAGRIPEQDLAVWKQTWPEIEDVTKVDEDHLLAEWERYFTQLIGLLKTPFPQMLERPVPPPRIQQLQPFILPGLPRWMEKEALLAVQLRGTLLMAAVELYRYNQPHQGRYPPTLQHLVPKYLPQLPKDPFTGTDFCYARPDNLNYKLYSAGPNKVDDGSVQKGRSWREEPEVVIINTLVQYPENQHPEGGPVPPPAPAPQ